MSYSDLLRAVVANQVDPVDFPYNGLVAYYKFDEESGSTAFDYTGNNNGSLDESIRNENGKINRGLGTILGAGVNITGVETFNGTFTYNVWVNPSEGGGFRYIFDDAQSRNILRVESNYTLRDGSSWANTGVSTSHGDYAMVSLVVNGSNTFFYFNSVLEATFSFVNGNIGGNTRIGRHNNGTSGNDFEGLLDEFGLWDRVLSQQEIDNIYNNGNGGQP